MNTISHPKNLETILPTVRGKVTGLWFNVLEYLFSYYLSSVLQHWWLGITKSTHTHTRLTALCPGLPGWAGTRKAKPIWILVKQEIVSGNGINWAVCKSAPRSRQITTPTRHHSVFYRPDALPAVQPTVSEHWRLQRASGLQKLSDEVSVRKRFKRFAYATATPSSLGSLESRMVCPSCAGLPWFSW